MSETMPTDPPAGDVPEGRVIIGPIEGVGEAEAPNAPGGAGAGEGVGGGAGAAPSGAGEAPAAAPAAPTESYEDYRARREAERRVRQAEQRRAARERARQAQAPAAAPAEAERTPEQRQQEAQQYAEARAAAAGIPEAPAGEGGATPAAAGPDVPISRAGRRGTPAAQEAARTVTRASSEVALAPVRGAIAAFASAFEAGDDLADWLNSVVPLSGVAPGDPGTPGRTIGRAIRSLQPGSAPETTVGKVSEDIAQFVTGFLRGQGVLRARGVLQGGGRGREAARAATAGAIADFFFNEADDKNLADAWVRAGLPGAALAEFLATDPGDEAALNRLRNAAAGVAVGAALDGAMALARAARAGRSARQQATAAGAPPPPAPPAQGLAEAAGIPARPERDVLIVGDPARPLFERARPDAARRMAESAAATSDTAMGVGPARAAEALDRAAREAAGGGPLPIRENTPAMRSATDPGETYINWGRIETPADVQAVMRDMADAFRGDVNDARRGIQTNEETARLANDLGLTAQDLLARNRGEAWNAETIHAARQLYTASGQKLLEAAQMAAAPGAGPLEAVAFRRMLATHHAIQAEVLGARAEAGRALQAWAIPATAGGRQMRMIEDLLQATGGVETTRAMAERLALLGRNLPPDQLGRAMGQFATKGWGARSIEAVQQVWINALLSSPATHLANVIGNSLNVPLYLAERSMGAQVGRLTGSADAALPGEAPAMVYGLMTGFRDALRLAGRTYGDDGAEVARLIGRQDLPRQGAVSSGAWGVDPGSGLGRGLDFLGHQVISAPGRAMGAEDAFFKSVIYRMELHAQAFRQAMRDTPRLPDGSFDAAGMGARMAETIRNPPESVAVAAADEALYRTFNRDAGPIASRLMALRNTDSPGWNLFASTVLPFVRTPANLFSYGLERTPMAPLVGQWRADVAAGGARRDAALARVALGSMVLGVTYQYAEDGLITGYGPLQPDERQAWLRTGRQPYSIRVGDTWVPYNRLDPYGFILGFSSDLREYMDRNDLGKREEVEVSKLLAGAAAMLGNALGERTVLRGITGLSEIWDRRDPSAERFVEQTLGSLLVPGAVASVGQAIDPALYDRGQSFLASRLAGLSRETLIPRRNIWGEPMVRPGVETLGAAGAAISPIRPTRAGGRPVDQEIERLGIGLRGVDQNGMVAFGADAPVNVRAINPQAIDQLRRWAGNEMGLPAYGGKGLADALDEMVQGQGPFGAGYERATDAGKARAIRNTAALYRQAARERLLADPRFRDIADVVSGRKAEAREGRGDVPVPRSLDAAQRAPGEVAPRTRRPPAQPHVSVR